MRSSGVLAPAAIERALTNAAGVAGKHIELERTTRMNGVENYEPERARRRYRTVENGERAGGV